MDIDQLDTPVAVVDLDLLEENIARLQNHLDACGLRNRPHIKTHKIPEIAHLQIRAGSDINALLTDVQHDSPRQLASLLSR